jgi:diketogulonate reductase-like aldo/keto reductase
MKVPTLALLVCISPSCESFSLKSSGPALSSFVHGTAYTPSGFRQVKNLSSSQLTLAKNDYANLLDNDNVNSKYYSPPSELKVTRRSAILSTTMAASSLIFLQPSPSHAEVENTLSPSSLSSPSSINLDSSKSCSSSYLSKPFPLASFGLQIYDNDKAYKLTLTALEAGYRNFFASVLAGNQKGFARAIKDSNISLSEIYICGTVLSNRAQGYKAAYAKTIKGCEENMNVMSQYGNIDKLDMIMLDYPAGDEESIKGQWDAFQDFQRQNLVNDLAVSNFNARQLDSILVNNNNLCSKPLVNQLPLSIANHPTRYLEDNAARGIHVQSWSPLSTTLPKYKDILTTIGNKYGKSAAQVGLRWIVQSGASYCVQSQKASHFNEDLDVFNFSLSAGDMEKLNNLEPPRLLG